MKHNLYTTSAIQNFRVILEAISNPLSKHYNPEMVPHYKRCLRYMEQGVKFKLSGEALTGSGVWDHLPDNDFDDINDLEDVKRFFINQENNFRLPYPITVFEYKLPVDPWESTNIIIVKETNDNTIDVYSLRKSKIQTQWQLNPAAFSAVIDDEDVTFKALYANANENKGLSSNDTLFLGIMGNGQLLRCFLDTLACLNVTDKKLQIPKSILGQAKKKHKNYYDYRELALVPTDHTYTKNEPTGITKRTHLRRGHIRRLKSGKTVWVNAHVVKPEAAMGGIVGKHYHL